MPEPEDEVKELRQKLEDHVEEYKQQCREFSDRQMQLQRSHEQTMVAITALTQATKEIVNAWTVANGVQKFIKWLSSFAIVGVAIIWIVAKLPPGFFK
jgi:phage shock protein A